MRFYLVYFLFWFLVCWNVVVNMIFINYDFKDIKEVVFLLLKIFVDEKKKMDIGFSSLDFGLVF